MKQAYVKREANKGAAISALQCIATMGQVWKDMVLTWSAA